MSTKCKLTTDSIKRKVGKYLTRKPIKGNGVLPEAKFFEACVNIFAIHGVMYPMSRRIFQRDGVNRSHYSSMPSFHHSNRTTLSLDPEVLEGRLSTGCERSELSSIHAFWPMLDFHLLPTKHLHIWISGKVVILARSLADLHQIWSIYWSIPSIKPG
jgi:hypothetical protein